MWQKPEIDCFNFRALSAPPRDMMHRGKDAIDCGAQTTMPDYSFIGLNGSAHVVLG